MTVVHSFAKANRFHSAAGILIRIGGDGKEQSSFQRSAFSDQLLAVSFSTQRRLPNDEVSSRGPARGLPFSSLRGPEWIVAGNHEGIAGFKIPRDATNSNRRHPLPIMRTPSHIQDTALPTREGHTHTTRTIPASDDSVFSTTAEDASRRASRDRSSPTRKKAKRIDRHSERRRNTRHTPRRTGRLRRPR